jgi:hypothetical protein
MPEFESTLRFKADDETATAFGSVIKRAKDLQALSAKSNRQMDADLKTIGNNFRALRRLIAVGGLTKLFTDAAKDSASFSDKLKRLGIDANLTGEQVEKASKRLRDYARDLGVRHDALVDGYKKWVTASGQSADEALDTFKAVAGGAKALNVENEDMVELVGTWRKNLKLTNDETVELLDLFAKTAQETKVPFAEISAQMSKQAVTMERLGLRGIKGAQQVLGLYTAIQAETKNAAVTAKMFDEAMTTMADPNVWKGRLGTSGGLQQYMQRAIADGKSLTQAFVEARNIFYNTGQTGIDAFRQHFGPALSDFMEKVVSGEINITDGMNRIGGAAGTVQTTLNQLRGSDQEQLDQLKDQYKDLTRAIGGMAFTLNNVLGKDGVTALESITEQVRQLTKIIDAMSRGEWKEAIGHFVDMGKVGEARADFEAVRTGTPSGITATNPNPGFGETDETAGTSKEWKRILQFNQRTRAARIDVAKLMLEDEQRQSGAAAGRAAAALGGGGGGGGGGYGGGGGGGGGAPAVSGGGGGGGGGGMAARYGGGAGPSRAIPTAGAGGQMAAAGRPADVGGGEAPSGGGAARTITGGGGAAGGGGATANIPPPRIPAAPARAGTGGPGGAPTHTPGGRAISDESRAALEEVGAKHGISPHALSGLIQTESKWNTGTRSPGGRYRGLTQIGPEQGQLYKDISAGTATEADQIRGYGKWLDYYKFGDKTKKAGVDFSTMSAAQQAAYLQGFQFAPNKMDWQMAAGRGQKGGRTTAAKQARALGSTSLNDMEKYYSGMLGDAGTEPTAPAATMRSETPTAPSGATQVEGGYDTRTKRVVQTQSGTRNLPITPQLENILEYAAAQNDVGVRVTSGGQPIKGTSSRRVGSTRHDVGGGRLGSADLKLIDPKTNQALDMRKPEDAARMAAFMESSTAAGATGVGAGMGYMGASTMHIGGGTAASWGGAGFVKGAHARGLARQKQGAEMLAAQNRKTISRKGEEAAKGAGEKSQVEETKKPDEEKPKEPETKEASAGEGQNRKAAIKAEVKKAVRDEKANDHIDAGAA